MAVISRLNYQLSADTGRFVKSLVAARSEMALVKRAMAQSRSPAGDYQQAVERLASAYRKGLFPSTKAYHAALKRLAAESPEAIAAAKKKADMEARATKILAGLTSEQERYAAGVREAKELYRGGYFGQGAVALKRYQQHLANLRKELPEVKQAAREQAAVEARLNQIRQAAITPLQRYKQQLRELADFYKKGKITAREFAAAKRQLRNELAQANGPLSKFFAIFARHPLLTASALGLIAFRAALRSTVGSIKEQFAEIDKLGKQAQAIGMAPEAMVALDRAARMAGVSTQQLYDALGRMNRTIGNAISGMGSAKKALADLGLNQQRLAQMRPERAFIAISEAINRLPTRAQQAAAAAAVFGRNARDLLRVLAMGRKGYAQYMAEAEQSHLLFSAEDHQSVAEMNDAVAAVKDSVAGLARQVAIQLAPWIAEVADSINRWLQEKENVETLTSAVESLGTVAQVAGYAIDLVRSGIASWKSKLETVRATSHTLLALYYKLLQAKAWLFGDKGEQRLMGQFAAAEWDQAMTHARGAMQKQAESLAALGGQAGTRWGSQFASRVQQRIAATRQRIQQEQAAAEAARQMSGASTPEQTSQEKRLAQALQSTNQQLRQRIAATMMDADALVRWKLAQQGANREQRREIQLLQQRAAAAERAKKLREATQQVIAELREQIATFGMSAEKIQRWKLAQQGAGKEQIAQIKLMQDRLAALKQQKALAEEAKQIHEQNRSPAQRQREELAKLKKMLAEGLISIQDFLRAKEKLAEPVKITISDAGVQAKAKGSIQAILAIDAARQHAAHAKAEARRRAADWRKAERIAAVGRSATPSHIPITPLGPQRFPVPVIPETPPAQHVPVPVIPETPRTGRSAPWPQVIALLSRIAEAAEAELEREPLEVEEVTI